MGPSLWAVRGLLAAVLVWSALAFSYIAIAVLAAWVAMEVGLRTRRRDLRRQARGL